MFPLQVHLLMVVSIVVDVLKGATRVEVGWSRFEENYEEIPYTSLTVLLPLSYSYLLAIVAVSDNALLFRREIS